MCDEQPLASDWALRVGISIYVLHDACKCHLYTNGATCVRCGHVKEIKEHWPYEWRLACQAYAEAKSIEKKEN